MVSAMGEQRCAPNAPDVRQPPAGAVVTRHGSKSRTSVRRPQASRVRFVLARGCGELRGGDRMRDRGSKKSGGSSEGGATGGGLVPGRRTLTQNLARRAPAEDAPVQARRAAAGDATQQ